ncbi:class I SAM-dependent methyltransferase [Nocardioides massiliensis]|uniref:2-polyprenyl-3-methyl-5-hydroxy-6-metoxy-1, 4-benzoquinol methylase n=1 Tax=Nocardioides massiliensis TaxID=1325935 RepID=A0ABT9NSP1_9ACTN|nr:class I SAM-dependent methyltransferase [Nocardioides massiliensis]MDP9823050.1 2-polyprenyl-3-methyl-5-hydroxy-6-metoxy-1,4-benzoquinol methylase [Nocardioides massiliensis]
MTATPRWFDHHSSAAAPGQSHSEWYVERFRNLAAEGADLEGEARLVDAMAPREARILDAGCGPGRLAGALHRRGHDVVGVDVDPVLIEAAAVDHPGPAYHVMDLADLDLQGEPFDLIVSAGNVMVFLAPGTERTVVQRLRNHVRPGGRVVLGFRREPDTYSYTDLDADAQAAGLMLEHRFGTWDLDPFTDASDFAISVFRSPAP